MIQRLRDLLAHARAGHRIGCETCAEDAWDRAELTAAIRRYSTTPSSEFITLDEATAGWNARPHTLYVADPDELRRSPVGEYRAAAPHEHFWSQPVDTAGTRECLWCGAIDTRPYREADHLPSTYDGPLRELREDGRL